MTESPARWVSTLALRLIAVILITVVAVSAQPIAVPDTYGGDFWSRPRLTGDWFGLRDAMAQKGIVVDADLLLTPQGVVSGGRDTEAAFWGNAEYTLNVDTEKAGLWPGGFLRVSGNSSFGESVLRDSGTLSIVNTAALRPKLSLTPSAAR